MSSQAFVRSRAVGSFLCAFLGALTVSLLPGGAAAADVNPEVAECIEWAKAMPASRAAKQWEQLRGGGSRYADCRMELTRRGKQPASLFAEGDAIATRELDVLLEMHLATVETGRKPGGDLRDAEEAESKFERVAGTYRLIAPDSPKLAAHRARLESIKHSNKTDSEKEADTTTAVFQKWRGEVTKVFEEDWAASTAGDAEARRAFDAGNALLTKGDANGAVAELAKARAALYAARAKTPTLADRAYYRRTLDAGLGEEIALALAKAYRAQGNLAAVAAEAKVLEKARPMMSRNEELDLYLWDAGNDRPLGEFHLPKLEGDALVHVRRDPTLSHTWGDALMKADAARGKRAAQAGALPELVNVESGAALDASIVGKPTAFAGKVTRVAGGNLQVDLRHTIRVPYDCRQSNRVSRIDPRTGRVEYQQVCKYRPTKLGYLVTVPAPTGVTVTTADTVEVYATVSAIARDAVTLSRPLYANVTPPARGVMPLGPRPRLWMGVPLPR
jgi:hypothetical protein